MPFQIYEGTNYLTCYVVWPIENILTVFIIPTNKVQVQYVHYFQIIDFFRFVFNVDKSFKNPTNFKFQEK